jgi:hypothetical protein
MNMIIATLLALILSAAPVLAEPLTQQKKEAIHELLTLTKTLNVGEIFGSAFTQHLFNTYREINPEIDPHTYQIVEEEVNAIIHQELNEKESLHEMMYPVYHEYLSLEETQELIKFYKTPAGQKAIEVIPQIARAGTMVAQHWGMGLAPEIEKRVITRLHEEGIRVGY